MFNAKKIKDDLVQWIRDWFEENGPGCNAIVGISGGKDSTVVAALCAEALGPDRVIGVMMPNGTQADIDKSYEVIDFLHIRGVEVNIGDTYKTLMQSIFDGMWEVKDDFPTFSLSNQTKVNLPPRLRMATLYAISQSMNGRVSNNCNLSEDWVGYSTRWGDSVGDFAPLAHMTVTEVKVIGYELGLPTDLIEKVPSDGLCGLTDEDNLGFSYDVLDRYIRTGVCEDAEVKESIDRLFRRNTFKHMPIPSFTFRAPLLADCFADIVN